MRTTPEQVIEHLAKIDKKFDLTKYFINHVDDDYNIVTISLRTSKYGEPSVTNKEIDFITEPFDVDAEDIKIYASDEDLYSDEDCNAIVISFKVPVSEHDIMDKPKVRVEPVFEGVQMEPVYCEIGEVVDISRNDDENYCARIESE